MSIKKIIRYISITFCLFFLYCAFQPLSQTRYTLTDGQNIIVFQSMEHIANPDFYKNVENDIIFYTQNGYTFLYEGIRPGKKQRSDKENNVANVPNFSQIGRVLGLTSQNDGDYFLIASKRGYDADVDEDWLMDRFTKKGLLENTDKNSNNNTSSNDVGNINFEELSRHKNLINFVILPLMRIGDRFNRIESYFSDLNKDYDPETEIIIAERNEVLYNNVKICKCKKIYINYGGRHFNNFYDLLKQNNKNWHIIEEKSYTIF
jgi:hypothetical protein